MFVARTHVKEIYHTYQVEVTAQHNLHLGGGLLRLLRLIHI